MHRVCSACYESAITVTEKDAQAFGTDDGEVELVVAVQVFSYQSNRCGNPRRRRRRAARSGGWSAEAEDRARVPPGVRLIWGSSTRISPLSPSATNNASLPPVFSSPAATATGRPCTIRLHSVYGAVGMGVGVAVGSGVEVTVGVDVGTVGVGVAASAAACRSPTWAAWSAEPGRRWC